jgi:hypothetical protein
LIAPIIARQQGRPDDRLRDAIQAGLPGGEAVLDWFVASLLAKTALIQFDRNPL